MFSNSKSAQWVAMLSDKQRQQLFKQAREKGPAFRKAFKSRRAALLEERSKIVREKQAAAAKKKNEGSKRKGKSYSRYHYHGIVANFRSNRSWVKESKTAKLKELKVQLDFRKKVLQQTHPNKVIFQSSHLGHQFSVDEMKSNLSQLLCNAG